MRQRHLSRDANARRAKRLTGRPSRVLVASRHVRNGCSRDTLPRGAYGTVSELDAGACQIIGVIEFDKAGLGRARRSEPAFRFDTDSTTKADRGVEVDLACFRVKEVAVACRHHNALASSPANGDQNAFLQAGRIDRIDRVIGYVTIDIGVAAAKPGGIFRKETPDGGIEVTRPVVIETGFRIELAARKKMRGDLGRIGRR